MSQTLEEFNSEGILTNLLAAEEHASGTKSGMDTWCKNKHFKFIGYGHHYKELLQLSENKPALHSKLDNFGKRWRALIDRGGYTTTEIKELRNEFREIIGDTTLTQAKESCGVCALDRRSSTSSNTESESSDSNTAIFVVAGILIAGIILISVLKKRA